MIQVSYIKVFSIEAYHTFFDNGKCSCFQFIPNNATDKTLKKFGFRLNSVANGFELYSNTTCSLSDLLDYIFKTTQQDYFEFTIKCSNPYFILFTQVPTNWMGAISYSSQDPKNQNDEDSVILSPTLQNELAPSNFGGLKIYFTDLLKVQNKVSDILYKINFTARATQWQYYFINKSAVTLTNPSITDKENIRFDGPKAVTIPTGESALLFTSYKTSIPLSEKPKYKFDLINKSASHPSAPNNLKSKIIIKGLPVPDVSRIKIIENNDQNHVVSPMYIYL